MDSQWSFGRVLISPAARLVTSADGMIWVLQRSRKMTAALDEWAERRGISVFARSPICQLRAYKSLFAREMSERLLGAMRSDGASDPPTAWIIPRASDTDGWLGAHQLFWSRLASEITEPSRNSRAMILEWGRNFYCSVSKWLFVHQEVGNKNAALIVYRALWMKFLLVTPGAWLMGSSLFPTVCYLIWRLVILKMLAFQCKQCIFYIHERIEKI